ncbi:MAG TPA: phosphotransferase [Micropepsaceae bacterium]|nr:phosphotransferase [Micropepsaceae bacterium]
MKVVNPRSQAMTAFLAASGWGGAERRPLPGDASTRHYIRLHLGPRTAMLMDQPGAAETPTAPPDATPEQRRALGYNALARLAGADCGRFVAASRYLRGCGLAAPDIYAADIAQGFLLLEDLGVALYTDILADGGDERALYEAAIDGLVRLHAECAPAMLASDKPLFAYDETALLAEVDLLTEWFFPAALGHPAETSAIAEHRALWREALQGVADGTRVFVHRDYHAQNLLWRGDRSGLARIGMIDFQDALAGSPAYDLVSLLEDARRDVAPELAHAMTNRYLARSRAHGAVLDDKRFRAEAALLAAQRNAKIIGIFARLAKRDGKARYLAHLPRVWRYMEQDLSHPELERLKHWYDRFIPRDARGVLNISTGAAA